jgi:hypothetical protein
MKKLTYLLTFIFLIAIIASCSNKGMKVVTREDSEADLSEYDTYAWVSAVENIPNMYALLGPEGSLVFNNTSGRKTAKDAIEIQMKARGFATSATNPEILVNFLLLEEATELRTFVLNNRQDYLGFGPRSEAVKMVPVEKGTILINFLDAKTGGQIWQGFASGALISDDMKDIDTLKSKVGAIFEDFDFNQFNTARK